MCRSAADQKHFHGARQPRDCLFELGELDRAVSYQEAVPGRLARRLGRLERGNGVVSPQRAVLQAPAGASPGRSTRRGGAAGPRRSTRSSPDCKLIGPSGEYEPVPLPRLWEELPQDAHLLVLATGHLAAVRRSAHLAYAELLNVGGQVELASALMDELVFARRWTNVATLRQHRLVLRQAEGSWDEVDARRPAEATLERGAARPAGCAGPRRRPRRSAPWPAADLFEHA